MSVESHLRFILTRYHDVVEKVEVTLSDINGADKGGVDKRCFIVLKLLKYKSIAVQATEADMYESIQFSCQKLNRAMHRHLGKKRRFKRQRIPMYDAPLEAA